MFRRMTNAVLILLVAPFVLWGCMKESTTTPKADVSPRDAVRLQTTRMQFNEPVSFDQLVDLAEQNGIKVKEILLDFGDFASAYTVTTASLRDARADFFTQHEKFLQFMVDQTYTAGMQRNEAPSLASRFAILLAETHAGRVPITGIEVAETDVPFARLNARLMPTLPPKLPSSTDRTVPQLLSTHGERWAPYKGYSKVTQWETYQKFVFNNVDDFIDISTYEHETQIYDKNFADYANYYSSNLSSAYKDTQVMDGNIDNFTVGTPFADYLNVNFTYWTYMSLRPGTTSSATCRIKGQWGYKWPKDCVSTWCIWPIATSGSLAYLAIPNYGVNWTY